MPTHQKIELSRLDPFVHGIGKAILADIKEDYLALLSDRLTEERRYQRIESALQEQLQQSIEERDRAHEFADSLAQKIARITGVDIGEHSNLNCPWHSALEAAERMCADGVHKELG